MTDIPNTEYITINKDGIFVGGKPATHYRGERIWWTGEVPRYFVGIQNLNPDVTELHVLSSETLGKWAVVGNPSRQHGPHVWCRVKFNDGHIGSWVFYATRSSATLCARICAYGCAYGVRGYADFRSAVFGAVDEQNKKPVIHPETELKQKLQGPDLLKLAGKPVQYTEYITVKRDDMGRIGIFVGGKPATKYHEQEILDVHYVKQIFELTQEKKPKIDEFHIGAFETCGEFATTGNPSGKFGPHSWCRVKYKNGEFGPWVFDYTYDSSNMCAQHCAGDCANSIAGVREIRSAVLGAIDKEETSQKPINPVAGAVNNNKQNKR